MAGALRRLLLALAVVRAVADARASPDALGECTHEPFTGMIWATDDESLVGIREGRRGVRPHAADCIDSDIDPSSAPNPPQSHQPQVNLRPTQSRPPDRP